MSDSEMRLPETLVIGPMKAGTTWLHSYFQSRGDVCLPLGVKETFFFDRNANKDLNWYTRHFRHYDPTVHRKVVEVGPSYFAGADSPRLIRDALGSGITLVVLMRDPVARAWSHYQHLRRMGYTRDSLPRAVECFPAILAASRYRDQLRRWQDALPGCRLVVLQFDDIRTRPDTIVRKLCQELEIGYRPIVDPENLDRNEAAEARALWLARTARLAATALRGRQLYGVVNLAKRLGLKEMVFGKPLLARVTLPREEREWLRARLADDTRFFLSARGASDPGGGVDVCAIHSGLGTIEQGVP